MLMISQKRGFSLAELMITISIMTIFAGISVPTYQKYKRQSVQTEAKQNLAEVYNLQTSHYSMNLDYEPDLEKLGLQPSGPLRYNVSAKWKRDGNVVSASNTSLHNVCPVCKNDETHDKPCCMMTLFSYSKHTAATHGANSDRCYGSGTNTGTVDAFLACGNVGRLQYPWWSYVKSVSSSIPAVFLYTAIGCISNGKRKLNELDIWAINNKKRLISVRDAAAGETTCSFD